MTVEALAAWLLAIMLTSAPPGRSSKPEEARETEAAGRARYEAIAQAIAEVSLDPAEAPLFDGDGARKKTAALLLAISRLESTWRRDVDLGLGAQATRKYRCLMQISVPGGKTPEGWTGDDLVASREKCFRRALHILQRGKRVCRKRGGTSFVNHYASGYCDRGEAAVKKRIDLMQSWLDGAPKKAPAKKPQAKAKKKPAAKAKRKRKGKKR
jgi:hypothetical protein